MKPRIFLNFVVSQYENYNKDKIYTILHPILTVDADKNGLFQWKLENSTFFPPHILPIFLHSSNSIYEIFLILMTSLHIFQLLYSLFIHQAHLNHPNNNKNVTIAMVMKNGQNTQGVWSPFSDFTCMWSGTFGSFQVK